jgi:hypothetical protein
MLSFQIRPWFDAQAIQIELDDAGIELLTEALNSLRGSGDHLHLKAPSAGGRELSDETPFGTTAIGEVIISHGGD